MYLFRFLQSLQMMHALSSPQMPKRRSTMQLKQRTKQTKVIF